MGIRPVWDRRSILECRSEVKKLRKASSSEERKIKDLRESERKAKKLNTFYDVLLSSYGPELSIEEALPLLRQHVKLLEAYPKNIEYNPWTLEAVSKAKDRIDTLEKLKSKQGNVGNFCPLSSSYPLEKDRKSYQHRIYQDLRESIERPIKKLEENIQRNSEAIVEQKSRIREFKLTCRSVDRVKRWWEKKKDDLATGLVKHLLLWVIVSLVSYFTGVFHALVEALKALQR